MSESSPSLPERSVTSLTPQDATSAAHLLESVVANLREPAVLLDHGLKIRKTSPSFTQALGLLPEQAEGLRLSEILEGKWNGQELQAAMGALPPGKQDLPAPVPSDPQATLTLERLGQATDEETWFLGHLNLTPRDQKRTGPPESRAQFQQLADSMPQIVWTARPDGYMDYFNHRWSELTGCSEDKPAEWRSVVHPDDLGRWLDRYWEAIRAGKPWQTELRLRDARSGEHRWFLCRAIPARSPDGETVRWYGTFTDINDQKKSEAEKERLLLQEQQARAALELVRMDLEEAKEQYRVMGEAVPYGVWKCDAQSRALYISQSFLDLIQMTIEEVQQYEWNHRLHPDDVKPMKEKWAEAMKSGQPWEGEFRVLGPDGKYHTVLTIALPVRNADGQISSWVGNNLDIEKRKQAEEMLARKADELKRSNAELEQFAYVVSHDLQEPLSSMISYVKLLDRRYRGQIDQEGQEFIDIILDEAKTMRKFIKDILEYALVSSVNRAFKPVDSRMLLEKVLQNLHELITGTEARVTHDEMPTVQGDESQLLRLFQNLVSNGIKFHGEKHPEVRISARKEGSGWLFCVKDNGIGIMPDHAGEVFGIFQRLHDDRPGAGIGLASCKKIVENHGGKIWVESHPGEGSTFCFTLPEHGAHAAGIPLMEKSSKPLLSPAPSPEAISEGIAPAAAPPQRTPPKEKS